MKKCLTCNRGKELSEFYKHPQMTDGHLNKCKECCKESAISNYNKKIADPNFVIKERKRGRNKYHRLYEGTGKANPKSNSKYFEKYPEKYNAKKLSATLVKPFEDAEKHHWSYNLEHVKDVIWLTKKDHNKAHRFIIYDQERFMYRRYDNNILLDTIESHETFIRACIVNEED